LQLLSLLRLRYWSLVSPGVVLIRYEMLRLVRREAAGRFRHSGRDQRIKVSAT
jgi:hypothetical protein